MSIDAFPPTGTDTDDTLQAIADLTTSANTAIYFTGADTAALMTVTPFIRTLLDDPDQATAQATLGVTGGGGGGGAPTDAEYIVGSANATLTQERVLTTTPTVSWDLTTAGQAKAVVQDASITEAKLVFTDVTTKDASVSAHGLLPKLNGVATDFLSGIGAWSAGIPGPAGPPGQSAGRIFYFAPSDASDIATYKTLLESPSAGAEVTIPVSCTGTGDVAIGNFVTEPGVPGEVPWPAGTVFRRIFASVSGGSGRLHVEVYKRDGAGVETLVRSETSPAFTNTTVLLQDWTVTLPYPGIAMTATDRLVCKVYAQRVSGPGTITVSCYFEGVYGSHIQTTIAAGAQGPAGPPGPGTTTEEIQDAVGLMLQNTSTVTLTYNDVGPSLSADVNNTSITEAKLGLSDVTTKDASTTAHGLLRKLSGTATQYLDGSGAWTTPAGGGDTLWTRAAAGAPLSLATGLLAFWRMEEASGNRVDSVSGMALVPQGSVATITNATGKHGQALAMDGTAFTSLTIPDNPTLAVGPNVSFTLGCWVYVTATTGEQHFVGKGTAEGGFDNVEYLLYQNAGTWRLLIGNGSTYVLTQSAFAPVANQWCLVLGWYDHVADIQYIQVNNGTPTQSANTVGSYASGLGFEVGRAPSYLPSTSLSGRLDSLCFWKRVLTAQERTDLWNSGNGLDYGQILGTAQVLRPTTSTDRVLAGASLPLSTEPLESAGGLKLGTTTGTTDGTLRWSGTDFEGRKGGAWVTLTASAGQPLDATLTALAGLATGADTLPYATGTDTFAQTPFTPFARTLLDDTTQAAMRTTLGLTPGTDVQAQDAELQAIAGLTSAADRLPYFTGLGTAALATFTAAGRTLAGAADAAAQRTALGLGTLAQQDASAVAITGGAATGLYSLTVPGGGDIFLQGTLKIGSDTFPSGGKVRLLFDKSLTFGLVIQQYASDVAGNASVVFNNQSGTVVGYILANATGTSYSTTSDVRLKHAIAPLTSSLDVIAALNPVAYLWNADGSKGIGFLAHELMRVIPEAVTGLPDEVNLDGSIKPQQVDLSKCVPWLTAGMKELLARVQALEGA